MYTENIRFGELLVHLMQQGSETCGVSVPESVFQAVSDERRISFVITTVILLEAVFWSLIIFYMVAIDYLNIFYLQRYAIPRNQTYPTRQSIVDCVVDVVIGHCVVRPVLLFFAYPYISNYVSFSFSDFPSGFTFIWQFLLCMQIDDCLFYWLHRLFHVGWLYKYVHKKHHNFKHTIPIAVEWAHPAEDIIVNTFPTVVSYYVYLYIFYFLLT